jgi:hypothetical protein
MEQTLLKIPEAAREQHKNTKLKKDQQIEFVEEYPNHPVSETPAVFVPGMAANWEHLEDSLKILSEEGRHLFALVHPKKKMADVDIETQKAFSILSLIENKDLEKTDSWQRSEYVEKQGWATMPGEGKPDSKIASECTRLLMLISK